MSKIPIMPDLPYEFIEYFENKKDLMIFDGRIFIKRVFKEDVHPEVLYDLTKINIPHFNLPRRVFIDEYNFYCFLLSDYLKNHQTLYSYLKSANEQDILRLFNTLLSDLKNAHNQGLNPFDISIYNYLIDKEGTPSFIDFDISFYNNQSTCTNFNKTIFDISYFNQDNKDFKESNLILNDKMLLLGMLLQSLVSKYSIYPIEKDLPNTLELLQSKYQLSKDILSYLENILIKRKIPNKDDYFLDTLINPLLDTGLVLKK